MGWLFETEPSTKADYIRRRFTGPTATSIAPCVFADHSLGSRGLWALLQHEGQAFIVLFLIERDSRGCYGYKDVCESSGPLEVDCPLRFLGQAPEPAHTYRSPDETSWRDRVRAYHATKKARANLPRLKVGQRIRLGDPFVDSAHGDYTVLEDRGRKGYLLSGYIRLSAQQRKYVTSLEALAACL
jgi:hypothetical protein